MSFYTFKQILKHYVLEILQSILILLWKDFIKGGHITERMAHWKSPTSFIRLKRNNILFFIMAC